MLELSFGVKLSVRLAVMRDESILALTFLEMVIFTVCGETIFVDP